jgi:hypothetical protein
MQPENPISSSSSSSNQSASLDATPNVNIANELEEVRKHFPQLILY